ncbi:DEAD/DEAH box helicase [Candidatus Dependentiae bacterium]|nr:DEAD/DEAH box helicase [Candidatus Dependentiae bacterium]
MTFKELNLDSTLLSTIEKLGFTEPTEIQKKAIPALITDQKVDFHGQAQTGTGKTLAFGLPILHKTDVANKKVQALIVAPTRELAVQIKDSLLPFAKDKNISVEAIYGGVGIEEQIRKLNKGVQIIVGTPGRINDHLSRKTLSLADLKTLVLDEADIMLDMGFKDEINDILAKTPKTKETWLFSATIKSGIHDLMKNLKNPISISVSNKQVGNTSVTHNYCILPSRSRLEAICRFVDSTSEFHGFIFCQTKILTGEIAEKLEKKGYSVGALHGDMSQANRNLIIKKFKNKQINIVVATDVAARGIDVSNLTHVINFSLPEDHESYVHRSGRTGRAGKDGIAISFMQKNDMWQIQQIQRKFNLKFNPVEIPTREHVIGAKIAQAEMQVKEMLKNQEHLNSQTNLDAVISQFTENELKTALKGFLYEKYLSNVSDFKESSTSNNPRENNFQTNGAFQEIFFNLGSDDGINRDDVQSYLISSGKLTDDQIHKIRVIKRRTFIEIPVELTRSVLESVRNKTLCGKKIRINLVQETPSFN